ncbi:MAG: ABC transporter permease [Candidatus Melainabacteria bacterium]|nr:ABC transporter permease [Candidatus Melainabacteria bacterium]
MNTVIKKNDSVGTAWNKGQLILLPAGLWLVVFMVLPLLILLVYSLGSRDDLGQIVLGFNFENYLRFFTGPYLNSLVRSLVLASLTTAICLILGTLFSMWLAFSVPKAKQNFFMTLMVAPLWTSFLLRIYAWMTILRPTGLLTETLQALGWQHPPVLLYTPWAVLLGMVYNYLPFMVLPLYASLEKLDVRLLEAAADLGATPWRSFLKVTLPLSSKGMIAGSIMVFVPALGDYVTPDLLGGAKTMFIGNLIQNQFLTVRDWAFGSAVSTILIVIVSFAIWLYLKYVEPDAAQAHR